MASFIPSFMARGTDMFRGALGNVTWGPVLTVSKAAVTSLFARIEDGTLIVIDEINDTTQVYGQKLPRDDGKTANGVNGKARKSHPGRAQLLIRKESFWVRLFLFADMGFAEAFMLGEVECSDLTAFFEVRNLFSSAISFILTRRLSAFYPQSQAIGKCYNLDIIRRCHNNWFS